MTPGLAKKINNVTGLLAIGAIIGAIVFRNKQKSATDPAVIMRNKNVADFMVNTYLILLGATLGIWIVRPTN